MRVVRRLGVCVDWCVDCELVENEYEYEYASKRSASTSRAKPASLGGQPSQMFDAVEPVLQ